MENEQSITRVNVLNREQILNKVMDTRILTDTNFTEEVIMDLTALLVSINTCSIWGAVGEGFGQFYQLLQYIFEPLKDLVSLTITTTEKPEFCIVEITFGLTFSYQNPPVVILNHHDTTKPSIQTDPFSVHYNPLNKKIWGLGVCDVKGQLATLIVLIFRLALSNKIVSFPKTTIISAPDEEIALIYSGIDLIKKLKNAPFVIDIEPTGNARGISAIEGVVPSYDFFININVSDSVSVQNILAIAKKLGAHIFTDIDKNFLYISICTDSPHAGQLMAYITSALETERGDYFNPGFMHTKSPFNQSIKKAAESSNPILPLSTSRTGVLQTNSDQLVLQGFFASQVSILKLPEAVILGGPDLGRHTSLESGLLPILRNLLELLENVIPLAVRSSCQISAEQ